MRKYFLGIDPGWKSGGLVLNNGYEPIYYPMPPTMHDIKDLFLEIKDKIKFALIEKISPAYQIKGRASNPAAQAKAYGSFCSLVACLALCDIPYQEITSAIWQKEMNCLTKGDKHISRAKVQQLYPHVRATLKNADAYLISAFAIIKGASYGIDRAKKQ